MENKLHGVLYFKVKKGDEVQIFKEEVPSATAIRMLQILNSLNKVGSSSETYGFDNIQAANYLPEGWVVTENPNEEHSELFSMMIATIMFNDEDRYIQSTIHYLISVGMIEIKDIIVDIDNPNPAIYEYVNPI